MPKTWVTDDAGTRREVTGWWVGDDAGVRRKVEKVWAGDAGGVPRLVYTGVPKMTTKLTATTISSSRIDLSWTANEGSEITYFIEGTSGLQQDMGTALTKQNTGLAQKTKYNYRVDVKHRGVKIGESHASATTLATPVPATSSGSVNGPAAISAGGWTQSTHRQLNGPLFNISGYVSSFNVLVGGHDGATGSVDPFIGGTRLGWRAVAAGNAYRHVDGKNTPVSGSTRFGAHAGGSGKPPTSWQTYSGAAWDYNVAVGTVNYWWYTRDAGARSGEPWWLPEFEGVDIHVDSWVDEDGNVIRAVVSERSTGDLLNEWEA